MPRLLSRFPHTLLFRSIALSLGTAAVVAPAAAQPADTGAGLERVTVFGERIFRNRTEDINPVLSYGQEFFQRYEPESVGDMLKRVPGVTFSGDVGEFDAPQMRGLPSGYTQVLINGERTPGAGADRSIFVDRIPAELVERIEIVRSPSARQDSQGIGGTINIVLKDSMTYQGLFGSAGLSYYEGDSLGDYSGNFRGRGSLTWGARAGDLSWLIAASFTQRRTPKTKETSVFDGGFEDGELDEFITERDVRDSDDAALNWDFDYRAGDRGRWTFDGFYTRTERTERQFVEAFEPEVDDLAPFLDGKINVRTAPFDVLEVETELEDIEQEQWELGFGTEWMLSPNLDVSAGLSFGRFDNDIRVDETGHDVEDDEFEAAFELTDSRDDEWLFDLDFDWAAADRQTLEFGTAFQRRERRDSIREFDIEEDGGVDETTGPDGVFDIEEDIAAGYAVHTWRPLNSLTLEHGVRIERTGTEGRNPAAAAAETDRSYTDVNPSLNYRWDLTGADRMHLSVARTVRRPDFSQLTPFVIDESPTDDEATQGNPALEPETAWGVDLGYERQFGGGRGIAGVNVFYRDIDDLIELTDTGERFDDEFDLFRYENVGSGKLYGFEFDISAPLDAVGLPDTAVFGNYVHLESEVRDPFTGAERDFNLLPEYIYNVGFNHAFPGVGLSFGASLQGRGDSTEYSADEIETLSYDGFLEAFVEKRFGDRWVLRLTGSNLLDQVKAERKIGYDSLADFRAGNADESELELEKTGPWFRLVLRGSF